MFANRILLVTGGTGSFGTAVVRRLLDTDIAEIRVFSRSEERQETMRATLRDPRVRFYLGDVRDPYRIRHAARGADYVFVGAAMKQVPSCEAHPLEAVYTNILGTEYTLEAALDGGVQKVVVLSTDKAVYPVSAMGMTKAVMEKVALAKAGQPGREGCTISVTRFGNVLGSHGSVVPRFVQQILAGQPLTVTDPEMTRFMMTLPDAVDLVLYAFTAGASGDTFVQKAPAATIGQLARVLLSIVGGSAGIIDVGPRPGERQHEALMTREEMARATDHGRYYRIAPEETVLGRLRGSATAVAETEQAACTSQTAPHLSDGDLRDLLLRLDVVRSALGAAAAH
jgi:UDP-glucose 4-epimerase